MKIIYSLYKLQ